VTPEAGSKTGGDQSEKGDEKRAHRDSTRISRMIGTSAFSARTAFSVNHNRKIAGLVLAVWTAHNAPSADVAGTNRKRAPDKCAPLNAGVVLLY
jgi:hypothetical protein